MLKIKLLIPLFWSLLAPVCAQAQFLDYGADPARYTWNQARLERYTLIYPRGLDSMARHYALYLEAVYPHVHKTMSKPAAFSFPVVLHPGNMLSNGMVAWSPRRMELLTTPSARSYAEPWTEHLIFHESRHVAQTAKLMQGVFRPLYYLIGEQAAGVSSAFVPRWFFEGDAVGLETALSAAGRGRLPEFQMIYRTQMLSDKFFSFDKWHLGSYKDQTGDFYTLGYYLTSYARYRFGADIWDKTVSRYVSHLFTIPPFSKAFKRYAGIGFDPLFRETFDSLRKEWAERDSNGYLLPDYLSPQPKRFTSYQYPQALDDSTVISLKTGFSDIPALVAIRNGKEQRLTHLGSIAGRLILRNKRVYWLENISSLRWTHENYMAIKYYDLSTGRTRTLPPSRNRYIAFAVNDSSTVASQFTEAGENRIVWMDTETGRLRGQYLTPDNAFIKELSASAAEDIIFAVAVMSNGISLLRLDLQYGVWAELLKPTRANINALTYKDGQLFFESGLDGINNLYALDLSDGKTYRLTDSRFGAFQPSFSAKGEALLFSDYQAKGYRLASLPAERMLWEEADFEQPQRFTLAETLSQQEQMFMDTAQLEPVNFQAQPYHKASHLFHVHSWAPVYCSVSDLISGGAPDFTTVVKPGLTLMSQNALNTAVTQAGWYYERGYHHGTIDFSYMGWYPVFHLNIDYGDRAFDALWIKTEDKTEVLASQTTQRPLLQVEAQAYIPFNLTTNHYIRGIQPSLSYYFTNNRYQQYQSGRMPYFQYLLAELRLYNYRRMSAREILPRFGYQLRLQHVSIPFQTDNYSRLYAARLTTYWPGILRDHSLMLRAGYQYQPIEKKLYVPKQLLEVTRGYAYSYRTSHQVALKADYAFPILMPDLSIGQLAYVRRVRANLFYDHTFNQADPKSGWSAKRSTGADLIFDWNAFRFSFPLTTGVRLIQPLDEGPFQAQMLFTISF